MSWDRIPDPVVSHTGVGSGGGAVPLPPPPPPVPIAAGVTTAGDPFEEEDMAVNTRVPDTESELEADTDQPKARRTSRGRVPAPEKGQGGVHVPPNGQPSSKSMAQPARPSPVPARGSTPRRILLPARTRLPEFVFGLAVPELLRPHHGMPLVPWAAVAAMTRAMTTTKNGSFLRACLGPLVRPMSRDPTEMTIDQGPRLGPARIVAALRVRRRVEGDTDLVKVDARILARPDKGMIVAGIPAEADAMIADLLHAMRSPPRGAVRGEMSAADVMAPPMTVAIVTGTGTGMSDVTNQIPLRLADPRLATTVAVGMEEAMEVTAVDVGEMTHPETGKNPVQGGRQAPLSASALEGRGWRMCRRKTFSPTTSRVCRISLTSGTSFIDPESIKIAFRVRNTDGTNPLAPATPNPACFVQRVQVFANGQRCDDINYYGRTVAVHDLLKGREYNRNKAMEGFDEVNDPRIARAVHQGGSRPHRSSSRPCGTAGGDGLHCPVPLIRRCSCSSRTAAVRAGDGSPGDPV